MRSEPIHQTKKPNRRAGSIVFIVLIVFIEHRAAVEADNTGERLLPKNQNKKNSRLISESAGIVNGTPKGI